MQPDCVAAINTFIDESKPSGLVVCCRLNEYRWLPDRLKLNGAIRLEPLSENQVAEYLTKGGPKLAALREAVNTDRVLRELTQTPLMLSIMSLAYQGARSDELAGQKADSPEDRRKQIFGLYVEQMFQRKGMTSLEFPKEKIIGWLSWLARKMREHSQSVFLVEGLQPSWLGSTAQRAAYGTIVALSPLLIFGLIFGLIGGLIRGLIFGLILGLILAWVSWLPGPLGVGLLNRITLVETVCWKWNQFWKRAIHGSIFGLGFGLISRCRREGVLLPGLSGEVLLAGLIFGLTYGLAGGFTDRVKMGKAFPNQGVKLSAKNSLTAFLVALVIIALTAGLIVGLILERSQGLIYWLMFGLVLGLSVGLNRGGSAVIKHYALRLTLWLKTYTPLNFISFLDTCARLIFLKKVGGGYIFIHRMLLEYFAELTPVQASETATVTQDSEKPF